MTQDVGQLVASNGWQAGEVIPVPAIEVINNHLALPGCPATSVSPDDWLVVISQTCDIVEFSIVKEPYVEVLHCRPITKLRPEFSAKRSTRRLDFHANKEVSPTITLSAHASGDRYLLPRELLTRFKPDENRRLSKVAINRIQQWYALRYTRPAWPDNFNKRVGKKTREDLVTALKKLKNREDIEVRVAIGSVDEELEDRMPYRVAIFFVVDQHAWDGSAEIRTQAYEAFNAFVSTLGSCPGIDVDQENSNVMSGDNFSWQLTRTTDEWNFANLSERQDADAP